jgi:hypothetical protein
MALEAEHYQQTREALAKDPILIAMFHQLPAEMQLRLAFDEIPTSEEWHLTQSALHAYNNRGGTIPTHIGGPREALTIIAKEKLNP